MDVFEREVGFHISDLADEWMRTIWLATNYQLCHNDGMICCPSKRTYPPFGRSQMRRVKGEGLVLGVPGRSSLETSDIRARGGKVSIFLFWFVFRSKLSKRVQFRVFWGYFGGILGVDELRLGVSGCTGTKNIRSLMVTYPCPSSVCA